MQINDFVFNWRELNFSLIWNNQIVVQYRLIQIRLYWIKLWKVEWVTTLSGYASLLNYYYIALEQLGSLLESFTRTKSRESNNQSLGNLPKFLVGCNVKYAIHQPTELLFRLSKLSTSYLSFKGLSYTTSVDWIILQLLPTGILKLIQSANKNASPHCENKTNIVIMVW